MVITAAVCHFKSKGSSCDDVGDPDSTDGSGNCDGTRNAAAVALATFLATDPTMSSSPYVLILGDLNAYAMERPISSLLGAGYTDLEQAFDPSGLAYGFVFDGQLGTVRTWLWNTGAPNSSTLARTVGLCVVERRPDSVRHGSRNMAH